MTKIGKSFGRATPLVARSVCTFHQAAKGSRPAGSGLPNLVVKVDQDFGDHLEYTTSTQDLSRGWEANSMGFWPGKENRFRDRIKLKTRMKGPWNHVETNVGWVGIGWIGAGIAGGAMVLLPSGPDARLRPAFETVRFLALAPGQGRGAASRPETSSTPWASGCQAGPGRVVPPRPSPAAWSPPLPLILSGYLSYSLR